MKWFWYSLIGFCILVCSCKSKESAYLINEVSKENVQTEWNKFKILVDSFSIYRLDIDKSNLKITETIKIIEYDAQNGKPIKETDVKREIAQDSDKVSAEEENQTVTDCNGLKSEHFRDLTQKIESEVKEESRSDLGTFWEDFGKILGIIIGLSLLIGAIYLYLKKKFRVN